MIPLAAETTVVGIFRWLSPSTQWPGKRSSIPCTAVEAIAKAVANGVLMESEVLGLWCYARLLARMDSSTADKLPALQRALLVPKSFDDLCDARLEGPLYEHLKSCTAKSLLLSPSPIIKQTIGEIVAAFVAYERTCRKRLEGLTSSAFAHPGDRLLLERLASLPGAGKLMAKYIDTFQSRPLETTLLADSMEVTPASLPWLHDCYAEACRLLDVADPPPLYIAEGGLNAYTTGADRPLVVVNTGVTNLFDRQEMLFVLGHELGHVLAGHVKYGSLARWIANISAGVSSITLGVALPVTVPLMTALYAWMRRSEFTADRAGLLACQDREAALRAMAKFSGFPARFYGRIRTSALIEQSKRYRERLSASTYDRLTELSEVWGQEHPRTMLRAAELAEWIDLGCYTEIREAGSEQLRVIAQRMRDDPTMQELMVTSCRELCNWASENLAVPRTVSGPVIRGMLNEQVSPAGTPLDCLLRVELHTTKESADRVTHALIFLTNHGGKPVRTTLPLQGDTSWDSVPARLREELIRSGKAQTIRLLYTCG